MGNDVRPDDRIFELFKMMTMGCSDISAFLYPKLYPIHAIANNESDYTVIVFIKIRQKIF